MCDMCHTHIGSEIYSRRGNTDKQATAEMQEELEAFYDFHGSVREVMERLRKPQRIAALLRYFDADDDGHLNHQELAQLWAAANEGAELSQAQYMGACAKAGAESKKGLDVDDLTRLYDEGLADLDAHFAMLKNKLSERRKKLPAVKEECQTEEEYREGEEQEEEEEDEDAAAEEDDEDVDNEESDYDLIECEDEDEFADVMRVLGLEAVDITETGDLKLPNGMVAAHRDVAYVYRQRGQRWDPEQQLERLGGDRVAGALADGRSRLMLANAPAGTRMAVTKWQAKHEGKRVLAVLRNQQYHEMTLGMRQNKLQKNRIMKTRSVRGDMSGAGGGGR